VRKRRKNGKKVVRKIPIILSDGKLGEANENKKGFLQKILQIQPIFQKNKRVGQDEMVPTAWVERSCSAISILFEKFSFSVLFVLLMEPVNRRKGANEVLCLMRGRYKVFSDFFFAVLRRRRRSF